MRAFFLILLFFPLVTLAVGEPPALQINIPTVQFSDIQVTDPNPETGESGFIDVPWLGQYVSGVYQFLVGIGSLIASIMIMAAGLQWLTTGDSGRIAKAQSRIKASLTGLVILLGSYVILNVINPELVSFPALRIKTVKQELFTTPIEEEPNSVNGTLASEFSTPVGSNISGNGVNDVPSTHKPAIETVASQLAAQNLGIHITSSFRTAEKQKQLISENCKNPAGSQTCDPKPGKPQTCILRNNDPANCPHTTGNALDIWATGDGCLTSNDKCALKANRQKCFQNKCQAALIDAMIRQGFCVLASEPWHFEKPKMSSSCGDNPFPIPPNPSQDTTHRPRI